MPADSRSAAAICSTVNLGMPDIFFSIQTSNDERSGRELLINVAVVESMSEGSTWLRRDPYTAP